MNELNRYLEKLKDSPIADESYYSGISNLCGAISSLVSDICGYLESLEYDLKTNNRTTVHSINSIQQRSFQIDTIAEVIKEKSQNEGFFNLVNAIYHYKKTNEKP